MRPLSAGAVPAGDAGKTKSECFGAPAATGGAAFGAHAKSNASTLKHKDSKTRRLATPASYFSGCGREAEYRQQPPWHVGLYGRAPPPRRVTVHRRMSIQPGQALDVDRVAQFELHGDTLLVERQLRGDALEQIVAARAGVRGNQQRRRIGFLHAAPLIGRNRIYF